MPQYYSPSGWKTYFDGRTTETNKILVDIYGNIAEASGGFKDCISSQLLNVDNTAAVTLTVPTNTKSALIQIYADLNVSDKSMVVRFTEDITMDPFLSSGHVLGHLAFYAMQSVELIKKIRFIGIEAGKTHKILITYYS